MHPMGLELNLNLYLELIKGRGSNWASIHWQQKYTGSKN